VKGKKGEIIHYRYSVTDRKGVEQLVYLCNGNLVLNKTNKRFKRFLETFNERPKTSTIVYKEGACKNEGLVNLRNGWFSGFIDAEGCFSVGERTYTIKKGSRLESKKKRIVLRFSIGQTGEPFVLERIRSMMGCGSVCQRKDVTCHYDYMAYEGCVDILSKYLSVFRLKSIKSIDYKR
jgi:hypothetical protein